MWLTSKATLTVAVLILCLVAGLAFGGLLAKVIFSAKSEQRRSQQTETTSQILQSMGTLEVGDRLSDHLFEDFAGTPVRLSDVVHDQTWIAIIEPTCESCVEDMRFLKSVLTKVGQERAFVFVSASNPRFLRDLKEEIGLESTFLYDHRRVWSNQYNFFTYPFHIRVDGRLEILEVVAGALSRDQIDAVFAGKH